MFFVCTFYSLGLDDAITAAAVQLANNLGQHVYLLVAGIVLALPSGWEACDIDDEPCIVRLITDLAAVHTVRGRRQDPIEPVFSRDGRRVCAAFFWRPVFFSISLRSPAMKFYLAPPNLSFPSL